MSVYKFRILGLWVQDAVEKERIYELLTNGTLSPYDLIKRTSGDGRDQRVISKHEDFDPDEVWKSWRKLINLRSKLDELWKSQRDSLLAKITETEPESNLSQLRKASNYEDTVRENCLTFWRNEPVGRSLLDKQIKKRHYTTQFKSYIAKGLSFDSLSNWLAGQGLDGNFGCYAFFNNSSDSEVQTCLYVGMTAKLGFRQRLKNHFDNTKSCTQNFHKIHFWRINKKSVPGTSELDELKKRQIRCWVLEKLLIKKYQPLENDTKGNLKDSCDKIIDIIHSEIRGLCQDGELLSIEKSLEEKRDLISKLQKELNDSTIHMCDNENEELDGEGDIILSEEEIEEESQSNDENLDEQVD